MAPMTNADESPTNRLTKIENLDRVSIPAKSVATFDIRHPIHGTTYGVRPRTAFEAVSVHFSLCWAI